MRQRRNKTATARVLPAEPGERRRKRAPNLRSPGLEGHEWHALTRQWWHDVWHSPMAEEYEDADVHALMRLAVLVDKFWREPTKELAGEIRLQQQAFGLTPLDRRRLQWTVDQGEQAKTRTEQRRVRRAQAGEIDPRDVLKVVGK